MLKYISCLLGGPCRDQGPVVRRLISANPGLIFNPGFFFIFQKHFSRIIFSLLYRPFNWTYEKETWITFNPGLSANRPLNNWAHNGPRYESLKSKFSFILFAYNLMIGCSKKNRENYPGKCFWAKEKETQVKLNPGIALIGLWRTGSRFHEYFHKKLSLFFLDRPIITWQSKFYAAFFSKLWKSHKAVL